MTFSYTLDPVAMPTFDLFGFFLCTALLIILLVIVIIGSIPADSNGETAVKFLVGITVFAISIVFGFIYMDYKEKPIPKNEMVCGKRLDFSSNTVGGKSKSLGGFVQYEMCDGSGIVTIRTNEQKSYPEQLNFYKN